MYQPRIPRFILALLLTVALALTSCASAPPVFGSGSGGTSNAGGDASADPVKIEPDLAYVAPGALGDAKINRLGWRRDTEAPIAGWNVNLNLQPSGDGSGAVTYPQLQTIVFAPNIFFANAQNDPALTGGAIDSVARVAAEGVELVKATERITDAPAPAGE